MKPPSIPPSGARISRANMTATAALRTWCARHGGNESYSKLEKDPALVRMFAGYAFGIDFREKRGHAYMLADQDITERTKKFKQPGACLHCHASIIPAYRQAIMFGT